MRWLTLLLLAAPDGGVPARQCTQLEPANVEKLCDEHVMSSRGEVHWRSWALADSPDAVFEKYRKLAEACRGTLDVAKKRVRIASLDVSVHAVGTAGVPSCSNAPADGSRSLVLISTFTAR